MEQWATVASTLIAGVGLLFAGGQLRVMNRAAALDRRVAYDGVVAAWQPIEAPREADANGSAVWLYELSVHNPGRLPIDDIRVDWHFACAVQRRQSGVVDLPTTTLRLHTPVLPGGGERRWQRRLVMNFAEAQAALADTYALVHYVDMEGKSHTNRWPRKRRTHVLDRDGLDVLPKAQG